MSKPIWEVNFCQSSTETRVFCNGIDVTASISSVKVSQDAGSSPILELKAAHFSVIGTLKAAIDATISIDPPSEVQNEVPETFKIISEEPNQC